MRGCLINAENVHQAYQGALIAVLRGSPVGPRGMATREVRQVMVSIDHPSDEGPPLVRDQMRHETMTQYYEAETELYDAHELKAATWAERASKFWSKIANPDGSINSNYGYLTEGLRDAGGLLSQWDWVLSCLTADRDSRQAVMHFNRPSHQWGGNKDFPCTLTGTFMIRDGALEYSVVMRSQDVVKGFPYDLPFFMRQQIKMAQALGVPVGPYFHLSHSLHVYEKDVALAESMVA